MTECDIENTDADAESVAALEQQFPDWWIWVSATGVWWASRRAQLTAAEVGAGRAQWLTAPDAEELARLVQEDAETS